MRRLRGEEGIALPIAISVLAIVLMLVGVAVAYSIHSLDRSNRDRASARALAAADAGLDVAGWRMNKSIVANQFTGLLTLGGAPDQQGFLNQVISTLGCTNLAVNGNQLSGNTCAGVEETLDEEGGATSATRETFQYYADLTVNVDLDAATHLQLGNIVPDIASVDRYVISVGHAGGQRAVLLGKFQVDLNHLLDPSSLLSLFKLQRYVQCSSTSFNPNNPRASCPSI